MSYGAVVYYERGMGWDVLLFNLWPCGLGTAIDPFAISCYFHFFRVNGCQKCLPSGKLT